MNIKFFVGVMIYLLTTGIYFYLFLRVKANETHYDKIPNESKYRNSIFYIGDYSTSYAERSKHSLREAIFYLLGILIWFFVLMVGFIYFHIWCTQSVKNYEYFSSTGLFITAIIALFLSVVYINVFLFLRNPFITSVCLCQTRDKRGKLLKRRMLLCFVATLLLIPFALLGTNSYVYVTNEGVYEKPFFSMKEREYLFDENQELQVEKRINDKGEISALYCYMYNEETQINILNADLGLEMIQGIFENPSMANIQMKGDVPMTYEDAECLLDNVSSYDTKIVLEWFLNEYLLTDM